MVREHPFDSGGVLSRARPVLTFASRVEHEAAPPARRAFEAPRTSVHASETPSAALRAKLPVIPRIVRRDAVDDNMVLGPLVRGAVAVKHTGPGTALFTGLGVATLVAIIGLGAESLAPVTAAAPHAADSTATEAVLARGTPTTRLDAPSVPVPVPAPARPVAPPAHTVFAAAHAAKKHASPTFLAHR